MKFNCSCPRLWTPAIKKHLYIINYGTNDVIFLIVRPTLIEIKFKNTILKANEIHVGYLGLSIQTRSMGHECVVSHYLKTHKSIKGDQWNSHLIAMVSFPMAQPLIH